MSGQESQWKRQLKYVKSRMFRTKKIDERDMKTELRRCLSTVQLTFLGIGNTIGVGIYVLLGEIAKNQAGPAVIICFVLAIAVTLTNALVFAELSANVPQTGASYTFFYKIFGEYMAFLFGWIMFVSFTLSSSVGARAWSGMLDSFTNNSIQAYTTSALGTVEFGLPFAEHLDIAAFLFEIAVTIVVTCNVQCSSLINTVLGTLTTSVLIFVFFAGIFLGDSQNFLNAGHGGFMPFGVSGVTKGVAMAIYAASGFEIISISAEEAKDPVRSVPRAIVIELLIVLVIYIGASVGMLFLIPYWLIDLRSPLASAFEYAGLTWGKYIVTIGPLIGLTNLQMLGLYGSSRVFYRMASDNLFFSIFLKVNPRTGTPTYSVVISGAMVSVFALLFDLSYLVEFTVLLMLIANLALGSALIKLKVSESEEYLKLDAIEIGANLEGVKGDTEFDKPFSFQDDDNGEEDNFVGSPGKQDGNAVAAAGLDVPENSGDGLNESAGGDGLLRQVSREIQGQSLTHSVNSNRHGNKTSSEGHENDEDDYELHQLSPKKSGGGQNGSPLKSKGVADSMRHPGSRSLRARLWTVFSPSLPKFLSANLLIWLHWLVCMVLALQLVFGWHDIISYKPVAVIATLLLLVSLSAIMVLLWMQRTKRVTESFQTPLMPLVPTLAMVGSAVLLFSAISKTGMVELMVLVVIGSLLYFGMILLDVKSQTVASTGKSEEMKSLVDNEDDSEEEMTSFVAPVRSTRETVSLLANEEDSDGEL